MYQCCYNLFSIGRKNIYQGYAHEKYSHYSKTSKHRDKSKFITQVEDRYMKCKCPFWYVNFIINIQVIKIIYKVKFLHTHTHTLSLYIQLDFVKAYRSIYIYAAKLHIPFYNLDQNFLVLLFQVKNYIVVICLCQFIQHLVLFSSFVTFHYVVQHNLFNLTQIIQWFFFSS